MPEILSAVRKLDCADKVRIHYRLAHPIGIRLLERIPGASVDIQAFSRMVEGAKDHFTVTIGTSLLATGTLGESRMVVTYGKAAGEGIEDDIHRFESHLGAVSSTE